MLSANFSVKLAAHEDISVVLRLWSQIVQFKRALHLFHTQYILYIYFIFFNYRLYSVIYKAACFKMIGVLVFSGNINSATLFSLRLVFTFMYKITQQF